MPNELLVLIYWITLAMIVVNFLLGVFMTNRTRKIELKVTKRYFIGLDLFLFVHTTCRIFYFVYDYYYPDEQIWWELGAILGLLSITILIAAVESTIFTQTKHILTIIGIIGLGLMTTQTILNLTHNQLPINLSQLVQYAVVSTLALFMLFIYIYMAIKSTGNIRKSSVIMTIGILLFEIGQIAHTSAAETLVPASVYLWPIFMIVALILLYIAVAKYYTTE